jgi:hypothetical protein
MRHVRLRLGVLLGVVGLSAPLLAAEEGWRPDGRRVRGSLALEAGRLRFTPAGGAALSAADLTRVCFAEATPPPFRVAGVRRVRLHDGQQITGQFLELNKDALSLRPAWAPRVQLPRSAVAALTVLPGWRVVAEDDFGDGPRAFTLTGGPAVAGHQVVLKAPGQGLSFTPATPIEAGRVGVNFQDQERPAGARWALEALFGAGEHQRRLIVTVAGTSDPYKIDSGGLKGVSRDVARSTGWHRLVVQFSPRSLRVTCDDDVLWYTLDEGPGGALRQVRLDCRKPDADAPAPQGAVAWAEFSLERAADESPSPPADTKQDTLRLADGDDLFGQILRADRRAVQIEGRFGKRSLPWAALQGCYFRRAAAVPPRPAEGETVRLLIRSGLDPEADVLEGVVTGLDDRRLTLRHALLGELQIDRARLWELRPLAGKKQTGRL